MPVLLKEPTSNEKNKKEDEGTKQKDLSLGVEMRLEHVESVVMKHEIALRDGRHRITHAQGGSQERVFLALQQLVQDLVGVFD